MAYKLTRVDAPNLGTVQDLDPPSKSYRLYDTNETRNGQLILVWATDKEFADPSEGLEAIADRVGDLELVTKGGSSSKGTT